MIRKRGIVIFIVMTFLVIAGLFMSDSFTGGYQKGNDGKVEPGVRGWMSYFSDPLIGWVDWFRGVSRQVDQGFKNIDELRTENEKLREENARLMIHQQIDNNLKEKLQALQEALNYFNESEYTLIPCRVVSRDPSNWWGSVFVNRGSRDSTEEFILEPDLPVVTPRGVLGKTGQVKYATTQIVLLVDPLCKISGVIEGSNMQGIVMGDRNLDALEPQVRMRYINRKAVIKQQQFIVSSGLGSVFPAGLKVGLVKEVPPLDPEVDFALYREVIVEPLVDLSQISDVFILIDKKRLTQQRRLGAVTN